MNVFQLLVEYRVAFLNGLKVTIELCLISWAVGILIGILLGAISYKLGIISQKIINVTSFFLFSIPFIVLLYWFHYPFQILIGFNIEPFKTSVILLSLLNTIGVSKITLDALKDFPKEYIIAGKVCGLSPGQIINKIQIPLIYRSILPSILNLQVNILHMTLFTSLISVEELFRVCQRINSQAYKPVEIYTLLALFFIIVCLPLNALAIYFKSKLNKTAR